MRTGSVLFTILLVFCLAHPAAALTKRSKKDECTLCHVLWMDAFLTDEQTLLGPTQENIVIAGSIGLSSSKRICYSCHDGYVKDSRTAIALDNKHHQLKKVPDWLELKGNFRLDINNEIYCGTCHGFHDVRNMGEVGSTPFMRMDNKRSEMCMACHTDKTKELGHKNHPLAKISEIVPRETIEKLGGKLGPDGEIICQSCHAPHKKPALLAPFKEAKLCLICHQNKKTVFQSDHNLAVTAPDFKNTQGKGVDETGPCSSCHIPHNGNGRWMWARKKDKGNTAAQACKSCHTKELCIKETGNHSHPLDVQPRLKNDLPLFEDNGDRSKEGRVQCPSCHNVHQWDPSGPGGYVNKMEGGPENSFLRVANESSGLCVTCHAEKKDLRATDHDLRITAPDRKNKLGMTADASGPCSACHVPHNAAGAKLWSGKTLDGNPASAMCLSCHERESEHIKKTIGKISHPIGVKPGQETGVKSGLPFFIGQGKKDNQGSLQCATCHNPHRWNPDKKSEKHDRNVEGDSSNSFLRVANTNKSALCRSCHLNKQQVVGSDHNLEITAPDEKNLMNATVSQSGPCGACHVPHNAAGKRLWAKTLSSDGDKDYTTRLCTSCHKENGAADKKQINNNSHPVNVAIDKINPSPDAVKTFPLVKGDSRGHSSGNVVCITCHDPHTWSNGDHGYPEDTSSLTNREGDGSSSFLRRPASPASDLCRTCHENQAPIVGSLHDLTVKQPQEKNLAGQAASSTGPCGVCHLVHNSPNSMKLWAREYGPVNHNENKIIALCTSCHSEGNVAGNKVQKIYTHPEGILTSYMGQFKHVVYDGTKYPEIEDPVEKEAATERFTPILINNVIGYLSGRSYTPIFNDQGKEVNVGKISCPSCHNVHKWNLAQQKPGKDEPKKDVQGSKFLRTESYNTICVECHGPDALYRYLYFHSPRSRANGTTD